MDTRVKMIARPQNRIDVGHCRSEPASLSLQAYNKTSILPAPSERDNGILQKTEQNIPREIGTQYVSVSFKGISGREESPQNRSEHRGHSWLAAGRPLMIQKRTNTNRNTSVSCPCSWYVLFRKKQDWHRHWASGICRPEIVSIPRSPSSR